jgi:outer membrane lipoprotein-sorting protein
MRTLLLFLLLSSSALAGQISPAQAEKLEHDFFQQQKNTRSLSAVFKQTVTAPGLASSAVSQGHLYFHAPDTLRVAFDEPAGEVQQLDARLLTTLRPDTAPQKRPANHPSAAALAALRQILRGEQPAVSMNSVVYREQNKYLVELKPQQPSTRQPQKITLVIDARSLLLESFSIVLPRGMQMDFRLSQVKRNSPLPKNIFQLP